MADDSLGKQDSPKNVRAPSLAGLTWPESGYPFYYCVIKEKRESKEKTFDLLDNSVLEIFDEGEAPTFKDLVEVLKLLPHLGCHTIYSIIEERYLTYIRSFNNWKRKERVSLSLKQTKSSSFEASLITVKELIGDKRLIFPAESMIKSQLTIFSKASLKDQTASYAVKAMTMVIDAFQKKEKAVEEEVPSMKAWW